MNFISVVILTLVILSNLMCLQHANAEILDSNHPVETEVRNNASINALVLSGGVSLGAYEAGVNYAILAATDIEVDKNSVLPRINVTTGASAGAINAIATAIQTCLSKDSQEPYSLFNNIFRDIWINVGFDNLLPPEFYKYEDVEYKIELGGISAYDEPAEIKDALFSRSAFKPVIERLDKIVKEHKAKKDCEVLVGLMVTKTQPEKVKLMLSGNQKTYVNKQSYAVPIRVYTEENSDGGQRIHFSTVPVKKLKNFNSTNVKRNYINLTSVKEEISFDAVVRATLASSAFPVAFSPIKLGYCDTEGSSNFEKSKSCPDDSFYKQAYFIDGGYFNNIPIGLAAELMLLSLAEDDSHSGQNFIYLDPDNSIAPEYPAPQENTNPLVLKGQLANTLPGLSTLRKQGLYEDFNVYFVNKTGACSDTDENSVCSKSDERKMNRGKDKTKHREYLPTERRARLTGNFWGAFGAFFDKSFRDYDYAVGVYDGLRFAAKQFCKESKKVDCESTAFGLMLGSITAQSINSNAQDIHDFLALIGAFIRDDIENEKSDTCSFQNCQWENIKARFYQKNYQSKTYAIYRALKKTQEDNFNKFLAILKQTARPDEFATKSTQLTQLEYMLYRPGYWESLLNKRVLNRLIYLEDENEGENTKLLTTAYTFLPRDEFAPVSIGNMQDPDLVTGWYRYIPNHLGLDAVQTGLVVGKSWMPNWDHWVPYHGNVELGVSFHSQIKDQSENRVDYINGWAGLRWNRSSTAFSSYGFALTVNRNISNTSNFGSKEMIGGEFNVSFLSDKLRLSIGTRDAISNYRGEDWSVQLTVTNIDELIWAFGR